MRVTGVRVGNTLGVKQQQFGEYKVVLAADNQESVERWCRWSELSTFESTLDDGILHKLPHFPARPEWALAGLRGVSLKSAFLEAAVTPSRSPR